MSSRSGFADRTETRARRSGALRRRVPVTSRGAPGGVVRSEPLGELPHFLLLEQNIRAPPLQLEPFDRAIEPCGIQDVVPHRQTTAVVSQGADVRCRDDHSRWVRHAADQFGDRRISAFAFSWGVHAKLPCGADSLDAEPEQDERGCRASPRSALSGHADDQRGHADEDGRPRRQKKSQIGDRGVRGLYSVSGLVVLGNSRTRERGKAGSWKLGAGSWELE
jgi:hypothetical protein